MQHAPIKQLLSGFSRSSNTWFIRYTQQYFKSLFFQMPTLHLIPVHDPLGRLFSSVFVVKHGAHARPLAEASCSSPAVPAGPCWGRRCPAVPGAVRGLRSAEETCTNMPINTQPQTHPVHFQNISVMFTSGCRPISNGRISLYKNTLICINQAQLFLHLLEKLDPPLSLTCPA